MESGDIPTGTEVGVRELRNHLSRYLGRVESGDTFVVTDHGRAVAQLVPVSGERPIDRLVKEGVVVRPRRRGRPSVEPVPADGTVSDLVAQQRR
jgi:prevent-host-death family protein